MSLARTHNPVSRGVTAQGTRRVGAWAGMIGSSLFVAVFTIEGWLRPGYNAYGNYVSELSFGPRGWIQRINFVVLGILFLLFTRGVAEEFQDGEASTAGPILLTIIGFSLLGSGLLVTDPMAMFGRQTSWHGILHGVLGALVFSLAPATCFVFLRRFRKDPAWRALRLWTAAAGGINVVALVLMKVGQAPLSPMHASVGLVQRIALVTYLGWIFSFAWRLRQR